LVANLSCSLIEHGRIKTTLAKARALRPSIEKIVTLAKKAHASSDPAKKVHYRRLAIARLRNKTAVSKLFDELVDQFLKRSGGYTRIYKLALPRLGDAADMALIEFVEEPPKKKASKKNSKKKIGKSESKSANEKQEDIPAEKPESEEPVEAVASVEVNEKIPAPEEAASSSEEPADVQEDEAHSQIEDANPEGSTESK
jgi:large subunit ribosomal protein L17